MPLVQEKDRPTESSEPNIADGKSSGPASMAPETEAGDKPFPFLGLLCYADALDWLLMVRGPWDPSYMAWGLQCRTTYLGNLLM